ncbi:hypothetical protein [Burkholderia pseudomallei]|uniref:hypothetical protein n=1 Tax=Burkholderia pseudomallei TaxID=28450 RepID=UPI000975A4EC|nr:hypothetical protein [Burkholderia pseudomallei]MBM5665810.1 hypothetical protein [Burkholderia pseudomallei]
MDDIKHPNDFPPLTIEQIQRLAESIQDAFGSDFSRTAFTNHLLFKKTFPSVGCEEISSPQRGGGGRRRLEHAGANGKVLRQNPRKLTI